MRLPILIKRDFNKKPHFLAGIGKKLPFQSFFAKNLADKGSF